MKKKLVTGLLLLTMICSLTACGNKTSVSSQETSSASESISASKEKQEDNTEISASSVSSDNQVEEPVGEDLAGDRWLSSNYYRTIYRISGDDILETVKLDDYSKEGSFFDIYGRNIIFYQYGNNEENDEFGTRYFMINIDSKERKELLFCSSDMHYGAKVGNQLILVTCNNDQYKEILIDLDSLESKEGDLTYYLSGENSFIENYNPKDYVHLDGANEVMAQNGGVLYTVNQELIYLTKDGQTSYGNKFSKDTIEGYRKNAVIITRSSEDYSRKSLYWLNLENGQETTICDRVYTILGLNENTVYYSVVISDELEAEEYGFYSYDFETGLNRELYTCKKHHGMDNYIPGSDVNFIDGDIYYLYDDEKETGWYKYSTEKKLNTVLSSPIRTYEYLDYGKVAYKQEGIKCDKCGSTVGQYCGEYFVFDSGKIPASDVINKFFEDRLAYSLELFNEESKFYLEELPCDEHSEYYGKYSSEKELADVFMLSDKYVVVNMEGYIYTGGVHGMPTKESLLFNAITGEQVNLFDICKMSVEDFKTFVAQKTKEDYESYEEGKSPYFAEDSDTVYSQAYEYTSTEYPPIIWSKDGLTISFAPYELGPFASGFIEFTVPYEEAEISFD